jgi:hypothetical protein
MVCSRGANAPRTSPLRIAGWRKNSLAALIVTAMKSRRKSMHISEPGLTPDYLLIGAANQRGQPLAARDRMIKAMTDFATSGQRPFRDLSAESRPLRRFGLERHISQPPISSFSPSKPSLVRIQTNRVFSSKRRQESNLRSLVFQGRLIYVEGLCLG